MKRLAEVYRLSVHVALSAVPHPAITATLHECGAKLAMRERSWEVRDIPCIRILSRVFMRNTACCKLSGVLAGVETTLFISMCIHVLYRVLSGARSRVISV